MITGAVLPVLALLTRPRLRAIDIASAVPEATGLLRRVPLLAALPEPVLERLARESADGDVPGRRDDRPRGRPR